MDLETFNRLLNLSFFRNFSVSKYHGAQLDGVTDDGMTEELVQRVQRIQHIFSYLIPIIFSVIAASGCIGNLLVVLGAFSKDRLKNSTNTFIINLSIADLIFSALCLPFLAVQYVLTKWSFGEVWCKISSYLAVVSAYASVYTLVLLSFDRFLAVILPVNSTIYRTEKNGILAIVVLWAVVLISNSREIIDHTVIVFTEDLSTCRNNRIFEGQAGEGKIYQICFFAFGYIIPLLAITLLYGTMLRRLFRSTGEGRIHGRLANKRARANRRLAKMVVVVVAVFAFCWIPWHVVMLIYANDPDVGAGAHGEAFFFTKVAAVCLAYGNSSVNPVLYAFMSKGFRQGIREMLSCCCYCSCQRRQPVSMTTGRHINRSEFKMVDTAGGAKKVIEIELDLMAKAGASKNEVQARMETGRNTGPSENVRASLDQVERAGLPDDVQTTLDPAQETGSLKDVQTGIDPQHEAEPLRSDTQSMLDQVAEVGSIFNDESDKSKNQD